MARVQTILISVISIIYILHCLYISCNYILFEMFIFFKIVHLNTLLVLALKRNSIKVLFIRQLIVYQCCMYSVLHVYMARYTGVKYREDVILCSCAARSCYPSNAYKNIGNLFIYEKYTYIYQFVIYMQSNNMIFQRLIQSLNHRC